jgi:hypothetical protein
MKVEKKKYGGINLLYHVALFSLAQPWRFFVGGGGGGLPQNAPANSQRSRLRWAMGKFDGWLISAV